jgi:hypothetical protein
MLNLTTNRGKLAQANVLGSHVDGNRPGWRVRGKLHEGEIHSGGKHGDRPVWRAKDGRYYQVLLYLSSECVKGSPKADLGGSREPCPPPQRCQKA